jgi:hypothetical protein
MGWRVTVFAAVALLGAVAFYGCGDSGSGSSSTGVVNLSITDAPVDTAAGFYVTFTSFRLQGVEGSADGGPYDIPAQYQLINLMDFQGENSAILVTGLEVPAGTYKVRLDADLSFTETAQASWIEFDGDTPECLDMAAGAVYIADTDTCRYPVEIPSGAQSWFKPKGDVTVVAGKTSSFTVEFDLRKNVVNPSNIGNIAYKLKPTGLRLVNDTVTGSIAGEIGAEFLEKECGGLPAFVYLYDRNGAVDEFVPDDMHPANDSYVTSVPIMATFEGDELINYHYMIGFVPEGSYGVAFICNVEDDSAVDEDLPFIAQADAIAVYPGAVTTQDLPVEAP